MVTVETSVLVNQPVDKVFEYVTTPENDHEWYIGVESRDHTPGEPAGVGADRAGLLRSAVARGR